MILSERIIDSSQSMIQPPQYLGHSFIAEATPEQIQARTHHYLAGG